MSLEQYNFLMGSMLNQQYVLAKLRAEIEGREGRVCWGCRRFGHLACNCRNMKEAKGKPVPQNRFEVIASRVIQCRVGEEAKVRRQETVEERVRCFRYQGIGHYKWECPNIKVEKEKRSEEVVHVARPQKVQQGGKLAHPNWGKVQEYCGVENVPRDAQLLELGWMTEEVIVTYIECRWYRKKGMHRENNRGQGVLRGRKLEEAKWCGCSKQKKREEVVVHSREGKVQQDGAQTEVPKGTAKEKDRQRDVRRTFKMLREV